MARWEIPEGAGPKRHRVTLQSLTETADATGQLQKTWADVADYSCSIRQSKGSMGDNAEQTKAERNGQIVMRYIGPIDPTTQRFLFEGRVLWIRGIEDVGERHREYRIMYHELIGAAAE